MKSKIRYSYKHVPCKEYLSDKPDELAKWKLRLLYQATWQWRKIRKLMANDATSFIIDERCLDYIATVGCIRKIGLDVALPTEPLNTDDEYPPNLVVEKDPDSA